MPAVSRTSNFNYQKFPGPNSLFRTFQVLNILQIKIQDYPGFFRRRGNPVFNWGCWLTQTDPYNGCKIGLIGCSLNFLPPIVPKPCIFFGQISSIPYAYLHCSTVLDLICMSFILNTSKLSTGNSTFSITRLTKISHHTPRQKHTRFTALFPRLPE